jgi:hypothetical protein
MIKFSCRCKHVFELDEDMAGKQIQCPDCHLLVDVPTHAELAELGQDGILQVGDPIPPDPHGFEKLRRVYGKQKVDEFGQEIDIRQSYEELIAAGTSDDPDAFDNHPTAPKYDPETGELVRPLEIRESDRPQIPEAIPFANAALSYATPELNQHASMVRPLLELLMPINLAAMFFVLLAHVFLIMSVFSLFLSFFALFIIGFGLIAHYANVIEEVAIEERDELPRFLRHFNIGEDIWLPAVRVLFAAFICFLPCRILYYVVRYNGHPTLPEIFAIVALDIVGFILFPAVLLINITSGSLSNLRPDRVLGTMATIGWRYVLLVILFMVTFTLYIWGMMATAIHAVSVLTWAPVPWFLTGVGAYGTMILAIYLMHYFAWMMGLCYRAHHLEFPWVFQYQTRIIPGVNAPRHLPMNRPIHPQK